MKAYVLHEVWESIEAPHHVWREAEGYFLCRPPAEEMLSALQAEKAAAESLSFEERDSRQRFLADPYSRVRWQIIEIEIQELGVQ